MMMMMMLIFSLVLLAGQAQAQETKPLLNPMFESLPWEIKLHGGQLSNGIRALNQLLETTIKPEDRNLEHVVSVAEGFLQEHQSSGGSRKSKYHSMIEQIEALVELLPASESCTYEAFAKLAEFRQALTMNELESKSNTCLLGHVIQETIAKHGEICRGQYLSLFQSKRASWQKEIDKLEALLKDRFLCDFYRGTSGPATPNTKDLLDSLKMTPADGYKRFEDSRFSLVMYAVEVSGKGSLGGHEKCPRFLEIELSKPCQKFTRKSADIFWPALLDLALDESKFSEITGGDAQFEDDWRRFRICDLFVRNEQQNTNHICRVNKKDFRDL